MRLIRQFLVVLILGAVAFLFSCAGNKDPVTSSGDSFNPISTINEEQTGRSLLAAYDILIDSKTDTFTVTPVSRAAEFHYPLTNLYPNVLKIEQYGWLPHFWADISLTHPLPGSGIDVFDPRIIAIIPANPGVSFSYPEIGVNGNNAILPTNDGYTKFFDDTGSSFPGNVNPFMAYFRDQPNRRWSSNGTISETRRWDINMNCFQGLVKFRLIVDISTNFPASPVPIVDNAKEPVQIIASVGQGLTRNGGSAEIEAHILDWQGYEGIEKVLIESPALFTGTIDLSYQEPWTGHDNYYVYKSTISNSLHAPQGTYPLMIAAKDRETSAWIYTEFEANVFSRPYFNLTDITPPWMNFSPSDMAMKGNYLFIAAHQNGLFIFDVSDPMAPERVLKLAEPGSFRSIYIDGNFAYVVNELYGIQIFDIEFPRSAYLVKTINTNGWPCDIYVSDGYAYVADSTMGLMIIDIDPLSEAHYVSSVQNIGDCLNVCVSNGYAYVLEYFAFHIVDVRTPTSPVLVSSIPMSFPKELTVSGVYAYVADSSSGLKIIDIDPPENAQIVKTISSIGYLSDLQMQDNLLYIAAGEKGLQVVNTSDPPNASVVKNVETYSFSDQICVTADYAFIGDSGAGIHVIDINPLNQANLINLYGTLGYAKAVDIADGYAYVTNEDAGLQILDIDPVEDTHIVKTVSNGRRALDVKVADGYAYVAADFSMWIVDINPPEQAEIIKTVDLIPQMGDIHSVDVASGYAFVVMQYDGLKIIDIDPPGSAYIVKSIDNNGAGNVDVLNGYAYLADGANLRIYDIDPPETAFIAQTVDIENTLDVQVKNGLAYVSCMGDGMKIIDVNPLYTGVVNESVSCYPTISCVSGDFAYYSENWWQFGIIDISSPADAYVVVQYEIPGRIYDILVQDNLAYLACGDGGFRIIKLL